MDCRCPPSYNAVENGAFVRLRKDACPWFAVLSAKYLRACLMPDIYNKVKNKTLELIHDEQNVSYCSVATGMCSSQSMNAYMALAKKLHKESNLAKKIRSSTIIALCRIENIGCKTKSYFWNMMFRNTERQKLVTEMNHKSYSAPEPQRRSRWKKLALFFSFTNLPLCCSFTCRLMCAFPS